MAQIQQHSITVKISCLVRDNQEIQPIDPDMLANIEAIVQELVGQQHIVEVDVQQ
jgi:hypothetical protein